jgi:predicted DNA-binding transcriptional regulator AlpA
MSKKGVCMAIAYKAAKSSDSVRQVEKPLSAGAVLLTPQQLSERLSVPVSWIREKTRERARTRDEDPLPVVRLGKYVRFRWSDIEAWLQRQSR